MSSQPIIFNIKYTPYKLPKSASQNDKTAHGAERAFYNLTADKNIFSYLTAKSKTAEKTNALKYLQKSMGVFNKNGSISKDELKDIKLRLRANTGNIWHGFISVNQENSHKIDTQEKCVNFIKSTFGAFFKDAKLNEKNMDLMCALHVDRPHHLHIHFMFAEKAPKYKNAKGKLQYRAKGKIDKTAIDNIFVRAGLFVSDEIDNIPTTRQNALAEIRRMTGIGEIRESDTAIKKAFIELSKILPNESNLYYGSRECEPYREQIDGIVKMLISRDKKARKANLKFYQSLSEKQAVIQNICAKQGITGENIKITETIEADYKRRQGNLVINFARKIKPEVYERDPNKKYRVNDIGLKRRLSMSEKKIDRMLKQFLKTFGDESDFIERDFDTRLRRIEEELEYERQR